MKRRRRLSRFRIAICFAACCATGATIVAIASAQGDLTVPRIERHPANALTRRVDRGVEVSLYSDRTANGNCSMTEALCGMVNDRHGVRRVLVSVRQRATGAYWDGSSFGSRTERYRFAGLTANPSGVAWHYRIPRATKGEIYLVHVRVIDTLGDETAGSGPARFAVRCVTAPPAPQIVSKPAFITTASDASFGFTDAQAGVALECKLDGGAFVACSSPQSYAGLTAGTHSFSVRAVYRGLVSPETKYCWTVLPPISLPFTIFGDTASPVYPGGEESVIALRLTNPNPVAIHVSAISVTLASTGTPECLAQWFTITQPRVAAGGISIPANSSVTLPAQGSSAPSARMLESGTNQDACQGATLTLTYAGSAHS